MLVFGVCALFFSGGRGERSIHLHPLPQLSSVPVSILSFVTKTQVLYNYERYLDSNFLSQTKTSMQYIIVTFINKYPPPPNLSLSIP